jgi:hypothetical protein
VREGVSICPWELTCRSYQTKQKRNTLLDTTLTDATKYTTWHNTYKCMLLYLTNSIPISSWKWQMLGGCNAACVHTCHTYAHALYTQCRKLPHFIGILDYTAVKT